MDPESESLLTGDEPIASLIYCCSCGCPRGQNEHPCPECSDVQFGNKPTSLYEGWISRKSGTPTKMIPVFVGHDGIPEKICTVKHRGKVCPRAHEAPQTSLWRGEI